MSQPLAPGGPTPSEPSAPEYDHDAFDVVKAPKKRKTFEELYREKRIKHNEEQKKTIQDLLAKYLYTPDSLDEALMVHRHAYIHIEYHKNDEITQLLWIEVLKHIITMTPDRYITKIQHGPKRTIYVFMSDRPYDIFQDYREYKKWKQRYEAHELAEIEAQRNHQATIHNEWIEMVKVWEKKSWWYKYNHKRPTKHSSIYIGKRLKETLSKSHEFFSNHSSLMDKLIEELR